jgi:predicted Zn-dependent protease
MVFMRALPRLIFAVLSLVSLVACVQNPASTGVLATPATRITAPDTSRITTAKFAELVNRISPVATRMCRASPDNINCNFQFVIERDPSVPSNAYQSLDDTGRPILTFTAALLKEMENTDELAFIMGHEAAHHILGHLRQTYTSAINTGMLAGVLVAAAGGSAADIEVGQTYGAAFGARKYSQTFELEADRLGTIIAYRAGFDPVRGAQYFNRFQGPKAKFLGSHPPNAARLEVVKRTAAGL